MNKTSSVNNKKIFKNTVALYARMLLSMIVSLYTSRIIMAFMDLSAVLLSYLAF